MHSNCSVSVDASDKDLCQLADVFREFTDLVVRYCEEVRSPPCWFTERASVSLSAATAWRQRRVAW